MIRVLRARDGEIRELTDREALELLGRLLRDGPMKPTSRAFDGPIHLYAPSGELITIESAPVYRIDR